MQHLSNALSRLKGSHPFFLLDYDGTLVEIAEHPELARLSGRRRWVLRKLANKYPVAVLSGRSLSDIRRLVGVPNIYYGGNHGFELSGPGIRFVVPEVRRLKPLMGKLVKQSRGLLRGMEGVYLEFKGFTISFHYRLAPRGTASKLEKAVRMLVRGHPEVRISRGKKVIELRPRIRWDKGKAALWLLRRLDPGGKRVPVYIGDDLTDEDAFRVLKRRGITARVGKRKSTHAEYWIENPAGVEEFLRSFI